MSKKRRPSKNPPSASRVNSHLSVSHQSFSGPIPPPALLEGYESILPGAAERILVLAESEAAHRRELEKQELLANIAFAKSEQRQVLVGQFCALTISILFIVGGVFLVYSGKPVPGSFLSLAGLAPIVYAFLKKTNK